MEERLPDYELDDDTDDYEIINGRVFALSAPRTNHILVAKRICYIIDHHIYTKHGGRCVVFPDGMPLFLPGQNELRPDVMVVCDRSKIKDDGIHGAPDLVVEVLSPSSLRRDRFVKKDIYERNGVKEYWIVDLRAKLIEVYSLNDGKFGLPRLCCIDDESIIARMKPDERAEFSDELKSNLFDDLIIKAADVFADLLE